MSETQAVPQLSGNMFLFERPELLNQGQHGNLGLEPPAKPFAFCATARVVPLTVSEITSAMKYFPIVFLSEDDPVPLAVVGIVDDVNLFVDEQGQWDPYVYVPAYLRRYPFALASESDGDRHAIVLDVAHDGVKEGAATKFFDENGESTEATKKAIDFCKEYERERAVTTEIINRIKSFDLIKPQSGQYTPQGAPEPVNFANYYGVDEKQFNELSDEKFIELRKAGVLPIVYSQLMSLGNWRGLLQRRATRFNLSEEKILEKVVKQ